MYGILSACHCFNMITGYDSIFLSTRLSTASVPKKFDDTLYSLFGEYEAQNIPISVDFGNLLEGVRGRS